MVTPKEYRVSKNWRGKSVVEYGCPHCRTDLCSSLPEAGRQDDCPTCGNGFIVPGTVELHRLQEAEQAVKEYENRKKARAREEALQRREEHERRRVEALTLSAADSEDRKRKASRAEQEQSTPAPVAVAEPNARKPPAARLGIGGGTGVILLVAIVYFAVRGSDLRSKLAQCESYGIVNAQVGYGGLFGTDTVVFDLRDGGETGARRIDPVHLLMQFSSKLDLFSTDRVILARNGRRQFLIASEDLRPLADSYEGGGRIWAFNNLPASVRRMDGGQAYDEWSGGWLGVLRAQTEDLNELLTAWVDGGSSSWLPLPNSDQELHRRARESLQEIEDNVPATLESIEDNLPNVMADVEARMMEDAGKYGLSPAEVRAQVREMESGAREQIRGMEDETREYIRGLEDEVVESLRSNGR